MEIFELTKNYHRVFSMNLVYKYLRFIYIFRDWSSILSILDTYLRVCPSISDTVLRSVLQYTYIKRSKHSILEHITNEYALFSRKPVIVEQNITRYSFCVLVSRNQSLKTNAIINHCMLSENVYLIWSSWYQVTTLYKRDC